MVMAQPIEYSEGRRDTLTNPVAIAEVLSKSTKNYDKNEKFAAYRTIPSFQEYVLIDQYTLHVEQYCRTDFKKWTFLEYDLEDDTLKFASIPFQIGLIGLYDKVDFATEESAEP